LLVTSLDNPDVAALISEKNWRARDNKDWGGAKTTPIRPREEFTRKTDFKVSYIVINSSVADPDLEPDPDLELDPDLLIRGTDPDPSIKSSKNSKITLIPTVL
jgi:hypothetical protein